MIFYKKANNQVADQTARIRRLVCACVVRKPRKKGFLRRGPFYVWHIGHYHLGIHNVIYCVLKVLFETTTMFTVVPREGDVIHPPQTEIIDHNEPAKTKQSKWKKGKPNDNIPYDALKLERNKLIEAEKKYRARIKELEDETAELSKTYETTYQENKMLKGIIQHGPDAVKAKELVKVKKQQKEIIDRLEEENQFLTTRLNDLEQQYNAKDTTLDNTWNDALSKAKQKRSVGDKVPIQGPFTGRTHANEGSLNNQKQEIDSFDIQLDNLEKETHILLNKIHQLQKDKEHISLAINLEKGYITRNAAMNNALNEKLTRDLNKFASKLEKLKLKHKTAKSYTNIIGKGHKHNAKLSSINSPSTETLSVSNTSRETNGTPQSKINPQTITVSHKKKIEIPTPTKEREKVSKANTPGRPKSGEVQYTNNLKKLVPPRLNKTDNGHRSSKTTETLNNTDNQKDTNIKKLNGALSKSSNDSRVNTNKNIFIETPSKADKKKVLTFSPEVDSQLENNNNMVRPTTNDKASNIQIWQNLSNTLKANINSDQNKKKVGETAQGTDTYKPGSGTSPTGRYNHGPEPIRKKIKPHIYKEDNHYADMYAKRRGNFTKTYKIDNIDDYNQGEDMNLHFNYMDANKYPMTQLQPEDDLRPSRSLHKYGFPVQKNSKHIYSDDVPNDAVLTYLKNRPHMDQNPVSFNQMFVENEEVPSPSPVPIKFIDATKAVGGPEVNKVHTAKRYNYNSVKA